MDRTNSAPVPPEKDTGASYQTHIVSTGPYEFQSYQLNKTAVLVPNKYWNAAEDPTVSRLASKIVVNMNVNPNDVDNRLTWPAARRSSTRLTT